MQGQAPVFNGLHADSCAYSQLIRRYIKRLLCFPFKCFTSNLTTMTPTPDSSNLASLGRFLYDWTLTRTLGNWDLTQTQNLVSWLQYWTGREWEVFKKNFFLLCILSLFVFELAHFCKCCCWMFSIRKAYYHYYYLSFYTDFRCHSEITVSNK